MSVSATGSSAAARAWLAPISARPATAMPTPRARRGVSRSPRKAVASRMVKGAEACNASEASPAGIPAAMPA